MQRLYIAVDMMAQEIGYSYVVSASLQLRLSMRRPTSMAVRGRERSDEQPVEQTEKLGKSTNRGDKASIRGRFKS